MKTIAILGAVIALSTTGCSVFQASGEAVEATGRGAGHAVSRTADAVGDAGRSVGEGAGYAVSETGRAVQRAAGSVADDDD